MSRKNAMTDPTMSANPALRAQYPLRRAFESRVLSDQMVTGMKDRMTAALIKAGLPE